MALLTYQSTDQPWQLLVRHESEVSVGSLPMKVIPHLLPHLMIFYIMICPVMIISPFGYVLIPCRVRSWSRGRMLSSLLCIRLLYDSFVSCCGFKAGLEIYGYTRLHSLRSGIKKLLWGTLLYKKCSAPSSLPISIPIKEFRKTHVIHKDSHSLHLYRSQDSSRSCRMRCFWTDISTLLIIDLGRICIYHRSDFVLVEWCHCGFMDMGAPPVLQCF